MIVLKRHSSALLLAIPVLVVIFFSFINRHYELDDALIYLRYIRNYQDEYGLVYNPGEYFNALTSPLFIYLTLFAATAISNPHIAVVTISCLSFALASLFAGQIFSDNKSEATLTAVVVASFNYFYSTFGLETPLFLMLIVISLYLYKINSTYFVVALALLIITRAEGIFLAIPMVVDYLLRYKKLPPIAPVFIASIILITPFVFNYFYYGAALPGTASAKLAQGQSGYWGDGWIFLKAEYLIDWAFSNSKIVAFCFISLALYGVFVLRQSRVAIIALAFLVLLLLFYVGLNIPNYHWYYSPFFLLLLIFACKGLWCLASLRPFNGRFENRAFVVCTIAAAIFLFTKVVSFQERGRVETYANIGVWISQNTSRDASVGLVEIGTVGWYANRKIIDILGLVNKYNADYIAKRNLYGWLSHYQPDYILRHEPRWALEESTKLLEDTRAYTPAAGFHFPGFLLLKKSARYTDRQIARLARRFEENRNR